jgi:hypothetical protein
MKWSLIFNPFACLKLLLLAICIFTIGYLLAINVLIVELDDANGSKHKIASDPEHVYSSPYTIDTRATTKDLAKFTCSFRVLGHVFLSVFDSGSGST